MEVSFKVNGNAVKAQVEPRTTLSLCLRDNLRLTGTHVGCEHGVCGACTVIVDGEAVRSCLTLAVQVEGRSITTVEGLADGDALSPLQAAFRRHNALQCDSPLRLTAVLPPFVPPSARASARSTSTPTRLRR